jgi:hypothetical protein
MVPLVLSCLLKFSHKIDLGNKALRGEATTERGCFFVISGIFINQYMFEIHSKNRSHMIIAKGYNAWKERLFVLRKYRSEMNLVKIMAKTNKLL